MNTLFAKLSVALIVVIGLMGTAFFVVERISTQLYYEELTQRLNAPIAMYVTGERTLIENGTPDLESLGELGPPGNGDQPHSGDLFVGRHRQYSGARPAGRHRDTRSCGSGTGKAIDRRQPSYAAAWRRSEEHSKSQGIFRGRGQVWRRAARLSLCRARRTDLRVSGQRHRWLLHQSDKHRRNCSHRNHNCGNWAAGFRTVNATAQEAEQGNAACQRFRIRSCAATRRTRIARR